MTEKQEIQCGCKIIDLLHSYKSSNKQSIKILKSLLKMYSMINMVDEILKEQDNDK